MANQLLLRFVQLYLLIGILLLSGLGVHNRTAVSPDQKSPALHLIQVTSYRCR